MTQKKISHMEEALDRVRLKSIHDGNGHFNEVLPFVTAFSINVNPQTLRYETVRNFDKKRPTNVGDGAYVLGEFKSDPKTGLFVCYKGGQDGLGSVRRLEIGSFENPLTEDLLEEVLNRELYDEGFNHVVLRGDPPELQIYHPETEQVIRRVYDDVLQLLHSEY